MQEREVGVGRGAIYVRVDVAGHFYWTEGREVLLKVVEWLVRTVVLVLRSCKRVNLWLFDKAVVVLANGVVIRIWTVWPFVGAFVAYTHSEGSTYSKRQL